MEFHISRQARDRYQFEQSLFSYNGNVIFANFHGVRLFAQKINQSRDLVSFPEQAIRAGQLNAMGLIDEIMHHVIGLYKRQNNPLVWSQAYAYLEAKIGKDSLNRTLELFTVEFPPVAVYLREIGINEYLIGSTDGVPNKITVLEELLMLWIANKNPAFSPFQELFNDKNLSSETSYVKVMSGLHDFFETQPVFGPDQQNLVDMLRSPAIVIPYSLNGQLEYIRSKWSDLLGKYLYRLLSSMDLIKEEEKLPFGGPGPVAIPVYDRSLLSETELERFSPDKEWMPNLVLIAKNTYVWLAQLSQKYKLSITRLDQIPDAELDLLARWGFTGLWLIGLWERSSASAHIKQLCGNPEAIASAYSLAGYTIAEEIGGEKAYSVLRDKAWARGIRLASDMVPNHMGIDSNWVLYNPDRFISLDYSPFPSYSCNGPDLSPDPNIGIFLEDHYFSRTDAAVVFKRIDRSNGSEKYVYHGNDGTSMPWNDTAQLNYLNSEVREAIIQTILDVARKFPIIRFDAAMTLAKRHYQRLWFPEPGTGGAIPSRAEHGLTKDQFDAAIPVEFWREVVDRVAVEAPDTLLLAEAFWLMEGYFVRTLGMHRVYNSAFMNLLRNEENAKYRQVMKNTLEFDPEILKRYVNFMNNPDERTAVDQFGKGDKYFGICILMATLPGLPMFGHGQMEGFAEKYGMEFKRAYWDEQVDGFLVDRHARDVFPLLHRRSLFAGVENFLMYDFFTNDGWVNEDVYAYSNGIDNARAMVIYHNKFAHTSGWIRLSSAYMVKGIGDQRSLNQRTIGDGLGLKGGPDTYLIFRDNATGLEFIRPSQEIIDKGVHFDLGAYECHVFLDLHEIRDDAYHSYQHLCDYLSGRGVPSIQEALQELMLVPVLNPFRQIANPGYFDYLLSARLSPDQPTLTDALLPEDGIKISNLIDGIEYMIGPSPLRKEVSDEILSRLNALLSLPMIQLRFPLPGSKNYNIALTYLLANLQENHSEWLVLLGWLFTHNLGKLAGGSEFESQSLSWIDEWQIGRVLHSSYQSMGYEEAKARKMLMTVRLLINQQCWYEQYGKKPSKIILERWLADGDVQSFLGINRYKDVLWYNKESYEEFIWWMAVLALLQAGVESKTTSTEFIERTLEIYQIATNLLKAEETSDFQVSKLLEAAED